MIFAKRLAALAVVSLALAGCGPSITVENRTAFDVKVFVSNVGHSEVLSPSPGNSSTMDATEGSYIAAAVRSEEWLNYAKATRQYLNDRLANSDSLTGPQLLDVIQRLKDIAKKMAEYQNVTTGASCVGRVTQDADGAATISLGAGGALVVTCK